MEWYGYRRPDGSVGSRNHVIVLPVDDISNAAVRGVAAKISGTMALPHAYGRLQYGEDLELHFRTMIGTGANPNVAAATSSSASSRNGPERIVDGIAETGKPVVGFRIEGQGDLETVRQASRERDGVRPIRDASSSASRSRWRELGVSIKCGESDTTTGLGSCPTVGRASSGWSKPARRCIFGETSELTGGEDLDRRRGEHRRVPASSSGMYRRATSRRSRATALTCSARSRPRGTSPVGSRRSRKRRSGNIQKIGTMPVVGVLAPAEAPQSGARPATSWILPAPLRKWSLSAPPAAQSSISSRRARATSLATRSSR